MRIMSRPGSQTVVQGLLRRHNHHLLHRFTSSSPFRTPPLHDPFPSTSSFSSSHCSSSLFTASFAAKPTSSNGTLSRFSSSPNHNPILSMLRSSPKYYSSSSTPKPASQRYASFFRSFSLKSSNFGGKFNGDFAKKVFDKPAAAVASAFSRYREAIGLQIEAFFKRNYLFLLGAAGVVVCGLLWKIMFGIANAFVGISEGMAKYGFLALSTAIVFFTTFAYMVDGGSAVLPGFVVLYIS